MSDKDYRIFYNNYMNTHAATEATGLIQSSICSDEEWDSYRDVFNFEPVPDPDEWYKEGDDCE